jgi:hypothetical protein
VDEDIRTIILRDKPNPFLVVKPLYGAVCQGSILLTWDVKACRHAGAEAHKKTADGLRLAVAVL